MCDKMRETHVLAAGNDPRSREKLDSLSPSQMEHDFKISRRISSSLHSSMSFFVKKYEVVATFASTSRRGG